MTGMRGFHVTTLLPILLAALAGLSPAAGAMADATVLDFDVFLDQKPIGGHRFEIRSDDAGGTQVESKADFEVRLLGIRAYRYRHRNSEQWQSGCLRSIESTTDDNGRQVAVAGRASERAFRLVRPESRAVQTDCVMSYAYWDPARLLQRRELLNPQTGGIDLVRFELLGEETIQVRGVPVRATHRRLRGEKLSIDLWYSASGEWLQLTSTTDSKRLLHYRLRPSVKLVDAELQRADQR
ncbi:MAG: DUF6134 family protein [Steroidobacteraceae bacterium]